MATERFISLKEVLGILAARDGVPLETIAALRSRAQTRQQIIGDPIPAKPAVGRVPVYMRALVGTEVCLTNDSNAVRAGGFPSMHHQSCTLAHVVDYPDGDQGYTSVQSLPRGTVNHCRPRPDYWHYWENFESAAAFLDKINELEDAGFQLRKRMGQNEKPRAFQILGPAEDTSITNPPASSSTTRKDVPCALKPPSTIRVTSP